MANLVTLRPGARGTIQLVRKYGKRLIFVRYRYIASIRTRYKTVELIIDERPWIPRNQSTDYIRLYIEESDEETTECVLEHGAEWDADRKLWCLPEYKVHQLGLEDLVVPDLSFPEQVNQQPSMSE